MEFRMPENLQICDMDELCSFLVPAYGFEDRGDAQAYVDEAFANRHLMTPQKVRAQEGPDRFYASIPGWWDSRTSAQMLAERYEHRRGQSGPPQIWEVLRQADKSKPRRGYIVALLVDGRRQWYRHHVRDHAHDPGWWKRIDTGLRDCYAVWARSDGSELPPILRKDNGEEGPGRTTKHIYATRSGRGVIYAATTVYNKDGSIAGNEMRYLCIEFAILDRDSSRDDMLRITIVAQGHRFADPQAHIPEVDFSHTHLDSAWQKLIREAREGFIRECAPAVHENEEYRRFMLEQFQGRKADDAKPWGQRFEQVIENMTWEQAFALCKHPWQLAIAVHRHDHEQRFWDVPGNYAGSRGSRWPKMREALTLDEEQDERLCMWMNRYVVPMDNMWNYCGD